MARQNDPFWHHVEQMKCLYCDHQFAKDTSISRIKWHLSGVTGRGVAICRQVPKQVQEAAFLAMHGGNKRQKRIESSSNVNDNVISTTPQEQNNEGENVAGDARTTLAAETMAHAPGRSVEDYIRWLMEDDIDSGTQSLSTCCIWVGHPTRSKDYDVRTSKTIALINLSGEDLSGEDFQVMFPKDIQQLIINKCLDATSLCDVFSLINYATKLEDIVITQCNSMESLVTSSWFFSTPSPNGIFSGLKKLYCVGCERMKKLFPFVMLQNLVNLEEISVAHCRNMVEIIGEDGVTGEESSSNNMKFKLPKLRLLSLSNLPELKSICSAELVCDALQKIDIYGCDSMEILVPSSWICLVNLEKINICYCEKMEQIIGGPRSDEEGVMGEESSSNTEIKLLKLRNLYFQNLPELKSICSAKLICDSLKYVGVYSCNNMENLFPSSWSLGQLESLAVEDCEKMKEIIEGTKEIVLPELTILTLKELPELRSICSAPRMFFVPL